MNSVIDNQRQYEEYDILPVTVVKERFHYIENGFDSVFLGTSIEFICTYHEYNSIKEQKPFKIDGYQGTFRFMRATPFHRFKNEKMYVMAEVLEL